MITRWRAAIAFRLAMLALRLTPDGHPLEAGLITAAVAYMRAETNEVWDAYRRGLTAGRK